MTWVDAGFSSGILAAGGVVELSIAPEVDLQLISLGRGTVGAMYGRMTMMMDIAAGSGQQAVGAWGICLKESDLAVSTTAFNPLTDGNSTIWMQHRQFSLLRPDSGTNYPAGALLYFQDDNFIVKNPRKIREDEELSCVIASSSSSNGTLRYNFWVRVAIILP